MEREKTGESILNVETVVEMFFNNENKQVIEFLRKNKDQVAEFCLQVVESYRESDYKSAVARLSMLIEELL